jgi:hypothetical protein
MTSAARIISASRRTDVAGFHSRWLLNRLRAGFCHWIHPYTGHVRRVSLAPEDVLGLVLWTRNPAPVLPHVEGLRASGYAMAFQLTINGYGPPVESHNPPLDRQVALAAAIARLLGPAAVLWRYDPILLADDLDAARHEDRFARLAARLEGATSRCTFSFVDFYGKTTRNLARLEAERGRPFRRPDVEEKRALAARLADIAAGRGMTLVSCCDDALVSGAVGKSRCVDPAVVAAVRGQALPPLAARPTRPDCGCVASVDIGAYDTCAFGCAYCYAVSSRGAALRRLAAADPEDSVLYRPPSLRGADLGTLEASAPFWAASRPASDGARRPLAESGLRS